MTKQHAFTADKPLLLLENELVGEKQYMSSAVIGKMSE